MRSRDAQRRFWLSRELHRLLASPEEALPPGEGGGGEWAPSPLRSAYPSASRGGAPREGGREGRQQSERRQGYACVSPRFSPCTSVRSDVFCVICNILLRAHSTEAAVPPSRLDGSSG